MEVYLGVLNKAVSSTSQCAELSPVLATAALGATCTQGLPQAVERPSFWLGAAQLVVWFLFFASCLEVVRLICGLK